MFYHVSKYSSSAIESDFIITQPFLFVTMNVLG